MRRNFGNRMAKTLVLVLLALVGSLAQAQHVRWDNTATTTTGVGQMLPVLALPGASISFYTGCTALPCATPAVTYQSASGASCPSNAQVVWQAPVGTGCHATADSEGNFGGWFAPGDYQYTITINSTTAGPYDFAVAGGGGSGGCQGTVPGDNTSTNCGFGNQVGNTGTSVSTFGYQNVLNSNTSNFVTVVGVNNMNYPMGTEEIAIGDSNMVGASSATQFGNYDITLGYHNLASVALNDSICMGGYSCSNALYNSTAGAGERVIAFGNNAADNLGYAPLDIVAIGRNAASQVNGFQGGTNGLTDMVCIGDGACENLYGTSTTQSYYDIVGVGVGAAGGYGPGSTEITAIGPSADKQCDFSSCAPLPIPQTVLGVTAIGSEAGSYNQANYATAVGYQALGSQTVGAGAGYYNQGVGNTAIGTFSNLANSTGQFNTTLGAYAGADGFVAPSTWGNSNHTGSQNTWIGYDSGPNTTTQLSNTIALGYQAHNTASNQIVIGNASMTGFLVPAVKAASITSCLQVDTAGNITNTGVACGSGGGAVSSVSNSDGSLTITPTTGAVVGSINYAHAGTWTALETFNAGVSIPSGQGVTQTTGGSTANCWNTAGTTTACSGGGGSGVTVQNAGTPLGTATVLNFSTNTSASLSGGVATITATGAGGTAVDVLSPQRAIGSSYFTGPHLEYTVISSGATVTLLNQSGAGVLSEFWLATTSSAATLENDTVKITINGEGSPYITGTVSQLMSCYYVGQGGAPAYIASLFFTGNGGGCALTAPIPFSNGITVTFTASSGALTLWSNLAGDNAPDAWPYTEKLWTKFVCNGTTTTLCGTPTGAAPSASAQMQIANYAGSNPGRLLGLSFMLDKVPGGANNAYLEGNVRIFLDDATAVWAANDTFANGTTIMDPNGNQETWGGGTTGGTIPSIWGCATGDTTTDGTGAWTTTAGSPTGVWMSSASYPVRCMSAFDSSGSYVITVTTTGTTSSTKPSCSSSGQTITDGTVVWKCSPVSTMVSAAISSTGLEDFFLSSNYFAGFPSGGPPGGAGQVGSLFNSSSTIGAYRFFYMRPVRFNHSLAIYIGNGDSSEATPSGTASWAWTTYFYTQDTN